MPNNPPNKRNYLHRFNGLLGEIKASVYLISVHESAKDNEYIREKLGNISQALEDLKALTATFFETEKE